MLRAEADCATLRRVWTPHWEATVNRFSALVFAAVLSASATCSLASDKVASLLATLSTAKAQTEGRAQRVLTCSGLRDARMLQDLRGRYDSARNHFNGRIDAWIFSLQQRKEFKFSADAEAAELGGAIVKVNDFITRSDAALVSAPCSMKVFWKEALLAIIAVTPALIESVKSFWMGAETTDKEREALIRALEQYRIAEWGSGAKLVAFDLKNQIFIPYGQVTDELARQPATAIYVNKWIVRDMPGDSVVATKFPPGQLSSDYVLFTGKPSEIGKFVLQK